MAVFFVILAIAVDLAACEQSNLKDPRDGQTYRTVKIGNQVWMAENLNYAGVSSYCYDNEAANCQKYGRLYTWDVAMRACPAGWQLPSDSEWGTLFETVGGENVAGLKLKSTSGWYGEDDGSDEYGFSVLPAGGRYGVGDYSNADGLAYFWSSTESSSDACRWRFLYGHADVISDYNFKDYGYPVRCLRDSD